MKPNKSIAKRFKVTKTGKLKRHHSFTSHLMSGRSANKRRKLRKAAIVPESHARRLRKLIGYASVGPGKTAAARARSARKQSGAKSSEGTSAGTGEQA
jgi:large subunit ribosomal protein L35